jgi:hypothetical protein
MILKAALGQAREEQPNRPFSASHLRLAENRERGFPAEPLTNMARACAELRKSGRKNSVTALKLLPSYLGVALSTPNPNSPFPPSPSSFTLRNILTWREIPLRLGPGGWLRRSWL